MGSKHYASNVRPPATIDELLELGDYFPRITGGMEMPVAPAKVQYWIDKVRGLVPGFVEHKGHKIPLQVKVPLEKNTPRSAMQYIKEYYPEEHMRVQGLFKRLDETIGPRDELRTGRKLVCYGHEFEIQVPVPDSIYNQDIEVLDEYLEQHLYVCTF